MLLTGDTLATLAVAVAVFLLLVDQMHRHSRWAARYPPGPMPLPGLGNLLQVNFQDPLLSFSQLRRRFGDVFSLQQVWTPVVVLNGLAAVREALVYRSQDNYDRPPATVYEHMGYGPRSEGKAWREERRFSSSTLRNFGMGKKSLEQWVTEEASCLCAAFADQPQRLLNKAVSNVIASLTFGSRFEYNDLRILKLLDILEDGLKEEVGFVRQGTTLITNLSSVLKDETIWKKPSHFHPEHFLDAQGRFVKQRAPMPAHRPPLVPWEPLACMERFLFFTSLLQHLSFSVPTGQPRPSGHGVFAFLVTPSPYQLCALPC
uniref:Cytochrome P450 n=1 Tax=Phocoena sinus TaxID=42100 RepID=A0A8C9DZB4_PHOSS